MPTSIPASDEVYYAVKDQRGWDEVLDLAERGETALKSRLGSLISALLVASDDGEDVIAVSGKLSEEGTGWLLLVTKTDLIQVDVARLDGGHSDYAVQVTPFSAVVTLKIHTETSYFHGSKAAPLHVGLAVDVTLPSGEYRLQETFGSVSNLSKSDAVFEAFKTIRAALR